MAPINVPHLLLTCCINRIFSKVLYLMKLMVNYCTAVLKHHMIKGHRCDVRKALSREEMRDSRLSGGGLYDSNKYSSDVVS